jgi:ribonucleoside-triphosphate reductase
MQILKRDGSKELFKPYKIKDALAKAFESEAVLFDTDVFDKVVERVCKEDFFCVEEIQDTIEKELFLAGYFTVMQSFMRYRFLHKMQREHILGLSDDTTYINSTQSVLEYIDKSDWRINANANTSYSNAGLVNNLAGKVIANFWLDTIYSKEEGSAHREGAVHIHDLDCLSGYCAGWSLRALLNEGFNGVRGRIESSPPKHFREALGQMANFLGILQSEWAGAQAFSSFDTYLAPYVFADMLPYEDVKKAVRSFIYNLNVPARWGQSPFTNITLDWVVPDDLAEQFPTADDAHLFLTLCADDRHMHRVLQRGKKNILELTYIDFQPEMDLINRAYYEVMTEGDANGAPFTFPIPTVNITESFDWYGENTDILFENTAKIGSSYFQNFIGSQYMQDVNGNKIKNPHAYEPGAVRSMCCRLQLDLRELLRRGNGLFGSAEMTGSIGVVTINMPRLGYLYKGDKNALKARLEALMVLAQSTLEKKRVFIQEMFERGLYPYTKRYLKGFHNHFSTIGVNGMNEMVRNFSDDREDIASAWGGDFAIEILEFMRRKIQNFQETTGNLYNLEATPAEGTTYRFAKEDKKRFSDILQAGSGEDIYYTNSSQLPVDYTDDPFLALELQDELQTRYTGGTVLHLYMHEKITNAEACRRMVKNVLTKFKLPYITVTPLFSVCPKHGYLHGEHDYCPKCDDAIVAAYEKKLA